MSTSLLDSPRRSAPDVFTLAGQPFAIDVTQVVRSRSRGWTTVPLAPPHLVGVANLRATSCRSPIARAVLGWHRAAARASCRPDREAEGFESRWSSDGEVSSRRSAAS